MALITKAQIDARLAAGERVFLNLSNQTEKDIDKPSESPSVDPTLPIPTPILGADANAIGIMGKPVSTATPTNGDYIRYDSSTEKWVFNAGSGGGGGSTIVVRALDGTPTNTTATLQFAELSGFTLSNSLDTTTIDILAVPVNKLAALTVSRAVATDSSGFLVATSTPVANLAYLNNVTSDIQAQINTLSSGGSGITALTGDVTASGVGSAVATLASVGTAGTYTKVTTDVKGRITSGTTLVSGDLPSHTSTHAFSGLSGISLSSPSNGQVLQFNGTNWINATASSGGNAAVFTFTVNFDGSGLPASTSSLPSGWSTSISGSEVTVTHNTGVPPCSVSYFGLDTSGTPTWRYRLPTASNEVKFLNSAMTTQFIVTVNHTITGASLSSSAKVNILC